MNLIDDTKKDKPVFFSSQLNPSEAHIGAGQKSSHHNPHGHENTQNSLFNLEEAGNFQKSRAQKTQQQKQKDIFANDLASFGYSLLDNQHSNLEANPQKASQNNLSNLFHQSSIPLGTGPLKSQESGNLFNIDSIPGLREFSNKLPDLKSQAQALSHGTSPDRSKLDELKNNKNQRRAKDDHALADIHLNHSNPEGFKANKSSKSPIVLKHDPQVLQSKYEASKIEGLSGGNKSQPKTGFKLAHKLPGADEELAPQKKLKTDAIVSAESYSPNTEKQGVDAKRPLNLALTSSLIKN